MENNKDNADQTIKVMIIVTLVRLSPMFLLLLQENLEDTRASEMPEMDSWIQLNGLNKYELKEETDNKKKKRGKRPAKKEDREENQAKKPRTGKTGGETKPISEYFTLKEEDRGAAKIKAEEAAKGKKCSVRLLPV